MTALLLVSIAILAVGIGGSLVLLVRSGEVRVALLSLALTFLAVHQGSALWSGAESGLALGIDGIAAIALALAGLAGVGVLGALWRTLLERDRAEALHWNSMEVVRTLGELAVRWDLDLDEKLDHLLAIGSDRFGLEIGAISRVEGQRYEVIALRAPEELPVAKGDVLLLADTLCAATLEAARPRAFEQIPEAARPAHAERAPFGFESYLGAPVRVYGDLVGSLYFGSARPRRRRFTATDKDLVNLMSLWVGTELERRLIAEEREARSSQEAVRQPEPRRPAAPVARSVDVNAALRRAEKGLRAAAAAGVEWRFDLAEPLPPAVRLHVAVGAIVESLVHHAAPVLDDGGRVEIATADLAVDHGDPNLVPAVAPDRYVTVTLRVASERIDADSFHDAFEAGAARATDAGAGWQLQPHLTIAAIYRLLQRSGGDLSLAVEPGVGATFTLYLPRSSEAPRAGTGAAASAARTASPA